jgi:hypothetical protein
MKQNNKNNIRTMDDELDKFVLNMVRLALLKNGLSKTDIKKITIDDAKKYIEANK